MHLALALALFTFNLVCVNLTAMAQDYKKPPTEVLKETLSEMQFQVTQHDKTEPPFRNEFWDHKAAGIYVDVTTGEPLFSSLDKFDSGTGWPSFSRPISKETIVTKQDKAYLMSRTEIRSKAGDAHLGHVFDDGPTETGQRFCVNSASLKFIPVEKMQVEGYGEYLSLFSPTKDSASPVAKQQSQTAVVAGGCFWGVEELLRKLPGVLNTEVGYTGGDNSKRTYDWIKTGNTGHAEAVKVEFDPSKLSYADLLRYFFRLHDPTTKNRQGNDVGTQYRSTIFYADEEEKATAQQVIDEVNSSGKWKNPVVTELSPRGEWHRAEDYHQDYLEKNPEGYTCHFLRE